MSAWKCGKSPAGASGCLSRRACKTSGATSRTASSDSITSIATAMSLSNNFLWTRDGDIAWETS